MYVVMADIAPAYVAMAIPVGICVLHEVALLGDLVRELVGAAPLMSGSSVPIDP